MMQETRHAPTPGLVKLNSMRSLKLYLKDLLVNYERETDSYGAKVGRLIRIIEGQTNTAEVRKLKEIDWRKSGMLMVNKSEPERGALELMIEAMEDYKAKAARTAEVLAGVGELEALGIPENAAFLVYLRHGVPLRIVIDSVGNHEVDEVVNALTYR